MADAMVVAAIRERIGRDFGWRVDTGTPVGVGGGCEVLDVEAGEGWRLWVSDLDAGLDRFGPLMCCLYDADGIDSGVPVETWHVDSADDVGDVLGKAVEFVRSYVSDDERAARATWDRAGAVERVVASYLGACEEGGTLSAVRDCVMSGDHTTIVYEVAEHAADVFGVECATLGDDECGRRWEHLSAVVRTAAGWIR